MKRLSLVLGGVVAALLSAGVASGQALERVAYASVLDAKTKAPISGLGREAFRITEDGVVREVLRVTPASSPMPIAVLIDDSQAAQATIADLRKALAAFLKTIDGLGPVSLIGVGARPTIHLDYTPDLNAQLASAGRIFAQPGTGATLLDAIVDVSKGLQKRESDRAAIVIITTEFIEYSTLYYTQVLDALRSSEAMMQALVLLSAGGSMRDDPARNRATVLDRGPRESGGLRLDVLTSLSFESQLRVIGASLKNQYRIVYARPQTLIPPERVEVSATAPGQQAHGAPARGQQKK